MRYRKHLGILRPQLVSTSHPGLFGLSNNKGTLDIHRLGYDENMYSLPLERALRHLGSIVVLYNFYTYCSAFLLLD